MSEITDEYMKEMLRKLRDYTIVILRKTKAIEEPGADKIVWEHGRRNFRLRADGKLSIVCPLRDDSDMAGLYIFPLAVNEVEVIMRDDPAVRAGLFTFELHPGRSFPGDSLAL